MTLTSTLTKVQYNGDDSTTAFPITFPFYEDDGIKAILTTIATGVEVVQTLTTHYTLAGGDGADGTLTMIIPPATGERLTIKSAIEDTQDTSLPLGGDFATTAVERRLDIITRLVQQQAEELTRAVILSESSTASDIQIPDPTANKALLWNAAGDALENSIDDFNDIVTDATAAQVAAELAETNAETAETNAETAETNAETAETNAVLAQGYSEEWANAVEDLLVSAAAGGNQVDEYSSLHHAAKAAASAVSAAASAANPEIWKVNAQSTNYTVLASDKYKVIEVTTGGTDKTITLLPAATATDGFAVVIKKVDAGAGDVIIDGDGAELIDGVATITMENENEFRKIVTDGTDWEVIAATGGATVSFVTQETPTGTINGVNTTFTLATTPQSGTEMVWLDNIRMQRTEDYTISGDTITMIQIPLTGEILEVDYFTAAVVLSGVDFASPPAIGNSAANTIKGTTFEGDAGGTTINEFSTDGTMAGNSDDAVPTEAAIVTYVASEVAGSGGSAQVWAQFDNAGTLDDSFNVDSITDNGTGDWTVNITTDFGDTDYASFAQMNNTSPGAVPFTGESTKTAGTCGVTNKRVDNQANIDSGDHITFVAFGNQ